jgi:hypothetical protein
MSTDNGSNWLPINNGLPFGFGYTCILVKDSNLYAGQTTKGVYKSTNNGSSWFAINNGIPSDVSCLEVCGSNIFAGIGPSVYRSSNNGINWISVSNGLPGQNFILSFGVIGSNVFTGFYQSGIYLTTNYGSSWFAVNDGLPSLSSVYCITVLGNYIFCGIGGGGVWKRSLSELIGIHSITSHITDKFILSQNYPNPFNPATKIRFDIPSFVKSQTSNVKLMIYDILGREVITLVNQQLQPGTYEVTWDASNYPSCVYFYRLFAGDPSTSLRVTESKKMILIK